MSRTLCFRADAKLSPVCRRLRLSATDEAIAVVVAGVAESCPERIKGAAAAVARALEHIHLGWALVGCLLRLPVICRFAQLLTDASGGEPRTIAATGVMP